MNTQHTLGAIFLVFIAMFVSLYIFGWGFPGAVWNENYVIFTKISETSSSVAYEVTWENIGAIKNFANWYNGAPADFSLPEQIPSGFVPQATTLTVSCGGYVLKAATPADVQVLSPVSFRVWMPPVGASSVPQSVYDSNQRCNVAGMVEFGIEEPDPGPGPGPTPQPECYAADDCQPVQDYTVSCISEKCIYEPISGQPEINQALVAAAIAAIIFLVIIVVLKHKGLI